MAYSAEQLANANTKTCKDCGGAFPLSNFYHHRNRDTHSARCIPCHLAHKKLWYEKNKERVNAGRRAMSPRMKRDYYLTHRYGLTSSEVEARLERQDGCAVCHTHEHNGRGWHVDHDHACCPGARSCGKCIRGILCNNCNLMLGHAQDDINRLIAAVDYLEVSRGLDG